MKKLHKIVIEEGADIEVGIRQMKQLYAQSLMIGGLMTDIQFGQVILDALSAS